MCVLDTGTEELLCWGDNSGLIDVTHPATFPVAEPMPPSAPLAGAITDVAEVGVAAGGACVIHDTDQSVTCWGENGRGEAGVAPFTPLPGLVGATAVALGDPAGAFVLAVGWNHRSVRISESDALVSWGANSSGQLGSSSAVDTATPVPPRSDTPAFATIASDGFANTTCGLISGGVGAVPGRVRCWGENRLGQCGTGTTDPYLEPRFDVQLEGAGPLEDVVRVFVGPANGCAVTRAGELWCWGANDAGQLGLVADAAIRRAVRVPLPSVP